MFRKCKLLISLFISLNYFLAWKMTITFPAELVLLSERVLEVMIFFYIKFIFILAAFIWPKQSFKYKRTF